MRKSALVETKFICTIGCPIGLFNKSVQKGCLFHGFLPVSGGFFSRFMLNLKRAIQNSAQVETVLVETASRREKGVQGFRRLSNYFLNIFITPSLCTL